MSGSATARRVERWNKSEEEREELKKNDILAILHTLNSSHSSRLLLSSELSSLEPWIKEWKIFQVSFFFIHNIILFCYTSRTGHPIRFEWHEEDDDKTAPKKNQPWSCEETCSSSSGYWVDLLYVTHKWIYGGTTLHVICVSLSTEKVSYWTSFALVVYKSLQLCISQQPKK